MYKTSRENYDGKLPLARVIHNITDPSHYYAPADGLSGHSLHAQL